MEIEIEPGSYVVAVSGGVDSMVLLDMLLGRPGVRLTVAHFDHGIRPDSSRDTQLVRQIARNYRLPFVSSKGNLGVRASEAVARQARYRFLETTRRAAAADAVITAHHQDDVLETAIHNIIRGSGRRGLSSLKSLDGIKRPLLKIPKTKLIAHAQSRALQWREDSTNDDDAYTRNYIRHTILRRFDPADREKLVTILVQAATQNSAADAAVSDLLMAVSDNNKLERKVFTALPHIVAAEIMAAWLRLNRVESIDRKLVERLVHAAKTFAPGRSVHAKGGWSLMVTKQYLALKCLER